MNVVITLGLFLITAPLVLYGGTYIMATAFFNAKLQYQIRYFHLLTQESNSDPQEGGKL